MFRQFSIMRLQSAVMTTPEVILDWIVGILPIECHKSIKIPKKWEGSFEELRCCLFFEQRRFHHYGKGPEGEDGEAIRLLYQTICERWDWKLR